MPEAWSREEFLARLQKVGSQSYHHLHPFHIRMNSGELDQTAIQLWVANRFYYQKNIPLKDAAILTNCPLREVRQKWIKRINGLYTNLITSGPGLTQSRARQLAESGLDNIQLSFQAIEGELADRIAGVRNAHEQKLRAAEMIQESGIALSLNVVLHRFNVDQVGSS
jgi:pyrroloquinoline quinone (PQQ) biosynthesis protein C